jgi:hypothetical protein
MSDRVALPQDKAELVLARKEVGMRRSNIGIGSDGNIVTGEERAEYKIMARKAGRSGEAAMSSRAKKLSSCKGLKGCEFAECALDAMGKLPENILKSCPTLKK